VNNRNDDGWTCRHDAYVARPKRRRTESGIEKVYVTIRCRRKGEEGEWSLGTFTTQRQMKEAFYDWIARRRRAVAPVNSQAALTEVIDDYKRYVQELGFQPATIRGRSYTASQLGEFVRDRHDGLPIGDFDHKAFARYLKWLRDRTKTDDEGELTPYYRPQTIKNALIGARTLLRWAVTEKYIAEAPGVPDYTVPELEHLPLYQEDIDALLSCAEQPLDLMLRLMWENGLRIAEAMNLRPADLRVDENEITIEEHGTFRPKTSRSTRTIPVTPSTMDALIALGEGTDTFGLLFPCPVKCRYHYWRHRFDQAKKAAALRHFTFHDLRRAAADRLRTAKVPLDRYCRLMGHSAVTGIRHYRITDPDDLHDDLQKGLNSARTRRHRRKKQ